MVTFFFLLPTCTGEEQNKEALQDVEDENQWDTKANKRTHLWPPSPFPTKTLSVTLRTTKSDFYIGSQNLGSCPVGFLYFYFFLHSLKVLKGKSEFLWILLVPAFRFFKTLTGLHKGSFSITVLSLPAVVTLPSDLDVTPEGRVGRDWSWPGSARVVASFFFL